ncbi:substrate-binding periplasmic protein [Undibacterium sp. Xuan67W]
MARLFLSRLISVTLTLTFAFAVTTGIACAETINLMGEDDWYPYSAQKNGQLRGFAVDVIEAAYASVNLQVNFVAAPYARCLMLVKSGQQLGCFDSLKDVKLTQDFLFHKEPIFKAMIGIYAKSDQPESRLNAASLSGHKVGLTHGYTYGDEVEKNPQIVREIAPSDLSNFRKLLRGRSDYSLVYTRIADYLIATYPTEFKDKFKLLGIAVEDKLYVSFSKKQPDAERYANLLDKGLSIIRSNGTYQKIEQKWRTPAP